MKKLFTLVALAGLGLSTVGCNDKKSAPPPTPAPTTTNTPKDGGATPAPEGGASPATDDKK